jgi:hypothetical protein
MKQFTVHSLQFTKIAIILALMTVLASSVAMAEPVYDTYFRFYGHDGDSGTDYSNMYFAGNYAERGNVADRLYFIGYDGVEPPISVGLELLWGGTSYNSGDGWTSIYEQFPGDSSYDMWDGNTSISGYYNMAFSMNYSLEVLAENPFGGPPVPELPPYAGQMMVVAFGSVVGALRRRKARG